MTNRATTRPDHVKAPAHWRAQPVPAPQPIDDKSRQAIAKGPTRYGDWEQKGIAVDF